MAWQPPPGIALEDAYYDIASKLNHTAWNRFARSALRLKQNDIDEISSIYSRNAKEMKYRMFMKWQELVGSAASVETAYAVLNHFLFPKHCPKPDLEPVHVAKLPSSLETSKAVPDALPFVENLPLPIENYCESIREVIVIPTDRQFYKTKQQETGSTYSLVNKKGHTGCTFILNNMFIHLRGQFQDRTGSERDLKNMKDLWEKLGSEVMVHKDLKACDIKLELKNFSDFCDGYDYCTIFIMSHGTCRNRREIVYGNDHEEILVDDILKIFNNVGSKHLHGIPKLFFFQCCRGDEPDGGVASSLRPLPTSFTRADGNYMSDSVPLTQMLPQSSDMLVAYATHIGFQAFRDRNHGSWFVNAIGNVFMRHAKNEHVADLMTMVHNAVSTQTTGVVEGSMEMPEATSSLRKKLYFYPGIQIGDAVN